MLRQLVAVAVVVCFVFPASAREEPFGEETVEVRDWRKPPRASAAHQHHRRGHSHGAAQKHEHGAGHVHEHAGHGGHQHRIETEHLFGFTVGSDIDKPGVKHIISDLSGRFGKQGGSYAAFSQRFEYAFTPWRDFHVGLGASVAAHRISGVPGLDDRRQMQSDGLSLELRQRLLDRAHAPFGLTLVAEPRWARVEETSGARVEKNALELTLAADKELIKDRLFAALNLFYESEWVRLKSSGEMERESTAGIALAGMTPIASSVFVGGEARYLRKYEGAALNTFAGEALYLGPIIYVSMNHSLALVAAYSTQVAGRPAGGSVGLDLDHFERHVAKFKAVFHF